MSNFKKLECLKKCIYSNGDECKKIYFDSNGVFNIKGESFLKSMYLIFFETFKAYSFNSFYYMIVGNGRSAEFLGPGIGLSNLSSDIVARTFTYTDSEYLNEFNSNNYQKGKDIIIQYHLAFNDFINGLNNGSITKTNDFNINNIIFPLPNFSLADILRYQDFINKSVTFFNYTTTLGNLTTYYNIKNFYSSNPELGEKVYNDLFPNNNNTYNTYQIADGLTIKNINNKNCSTESFNNCSKNNSDIFNNCLDFINQKETYTCDQKLHNTFQNLTKSVEKMINSEECNIKNHGKLLEGYLNVRSDCGIASETASYGVVIGAKKTADNKPLHLYCPQTSLDISRCNLDCIVVPNDDLPFRWSTNTLLAVPISFSNPNITFGIQNSSDGVLNYSIPYLEPGETSVILNRYENISIKGSFSISLPIYRAIDGKGFKGAFVAPIFPATSYPPGSNATIIRTPTFLDEINWVINCAEGIFTSKNIKELSENFSGKYNVSNLFAGTGLDKYGNIGYSSYSTYFKFPDSINCTLPQGAVNTPTQIPYYPNYSNVVKNLYIVNPKSNFLTGWNTRMFKFVPKDSNQGLAVNRAFWNWEYINSRNDWTYSKLDKIVVNAERANLALTNSGYFNAGANYFTLLFQKKFIEAILSQSNPTPDQLTVVHRLKYFDSGIIPDGNLNTVISELNTRTTYDDNFILSLAWKYQVSYNIFSQIIPSGLGNLSPYKPSAGVIPIALGTQFIPYDRMLSILLGNTSNDYTPGPSINIDYLNGRNINQIIIDSLNQILPILTNQTGPWNGVIPAFNVPRLKYNITNNGLQTILYSQYSYNTSFLRVKVQYDPKKKKRCERLTKMAACNFHGFSGNSNSEFYVNLVPKFINFEFIEYPVFKSIKCNKLIKN